MTGGASAYASAEAANVSPLQAALNLINTPTQLLLDRPLIGNGGKAGAGDIYGLPAAGGTGGLLGLDGNAGMR
jgi:hypothetical protein